MDGFADDPNPEPQNLRIAVAVTIDGSEVTVDLTGTSPQIDLPLNMPFEGTVDIAVYLTIRSILLDSATHDPVPTELGPVPRDLDHRSRGLPGQPALPGADDRALLRRQPGRRHADAGASRRSFRTGSARGWAISRSSRTRGRATAATGSTWTSTRPAMAVAAARTASTRSTPFTRTPVTTRSRTSSPTCRSASHNTSCSRTGVGPAGGAAGSDRCARSSSSTRPAIHSRATDRCGRPLGCSAALTGRPGRCG